MHTSLISQGEVISIMKRKQLKYFYILLLLNMYIELNAQIDELKVGDTVSTTPISNLNDWRSCFRVSSEDSLFIDSLKEYIEFYNNFTNLNIKNNKCLFFNYWNYEVQHINDVFKTFSDYIFEYKPFRENSNISPFLASTLGQYVLSTIEYKCEYFSKITENEISFPQSDFNYIIYLMFKDKKEFLEKELKNNQNECYKKNIQIILNGLKLRSKLENDKSMKKNKN